MIIYSDASDAEMLLAENARELALYREVFNEIPDIIVLKDHKGDFLLCNQTVAKLYNTTPKEMVGKHDGDFGVPAEMADFFRQNVLDIMTSGETEVVYEDSRDAATGEIRHFKSIKRPFKDTEGRNQILVIANDITDVIQAQQRTAESERRLQDIMEATREGIWDWQLDTGHVIHNPQWYRILGYSEGELADNVEVFSRHLHPDDRPQVWEKLQSLLAGTSENYYSEHRMIRKDGSVIWVRDRGRVAERNAAGQPLRVIGAYADISEGKLAEVALRSAVAEAERANNAKSRFLAAASHDLRQPLSALSLYANVLKSKLAPSDATLAQSIHECVLSLSELLTDLLDLSKLEAGAIKPQVSDFAVTELLSKVVSAHAPEAGLKNLPLRSRASGLTARTDPVLFGRLLGNLVANAVRYTTHGGVLIACRRYQGKCWIEVRDTGLGIPEDKILEIFEEFRQLGNDARSEQKGSGLGLAIVAKSAALLGLQIRVRSRLGQGSLFAIELPISNAPPPDEPAVSSKPGPIRIGLVDDNAMVLQALAYALGDAGHELVTASSGQELLSRLAGSPPSLVVSDFRLEHGETGFDVITKVRAVFGNSVEAIIITGDTDPQLLRSMTNRGITVQHKPLDLDRLQAAIGEILREKAA